MRTWSRSAGPRSAGGDRIWSTDSASC